MQYSLLIFILLISSTSNAQLTASVDRNSISEGEVITLTISTDKRSIFGQPDFSSVDHDFNRLTRISSQTSMNIVNGKMTSTAKWTIELVPKSSGALVIPPIKFDGEETQAIVVQVSKHSEQTDKINKDEPLTVTLKADKKSAYVQEEIIFTIKAMINSNGSRVKSYDISEMKLPDLKLEVLEDVHYEKFINGISYIIVEQTIAAYPQKSGSIEIPSLNFTANFLNKQSRGFFSMDRIIPVIAKTNPLKLDIKPIPSSNKGNFWLPLKSFKATESWNIPDDLKPGDPVTRTITLSGTGTTESGMPVINQPSSNDIKTYPEQAKLSHTKDKQGIISSKQQAYALIPTREGEISVPAIQFQWWNTVNNKLETVKLPARTLQVSPGSASRITERDDTVAVVNKQTSSKLLLQQNPWFYSTLILLSMWVLTLIYFLRARVRTAHVTTQTSALSSTTESNENLKQARKKLLKTIIKSPPDEIRKELIIWAKTAFNDPSISSLMELREYSSNEKLNNACRQIDSILYNNASVEINREVLAEEIRNYDISRKTNTDSDLPELYPVD